ncbi:MAG TPA: M12 family metallo-peptidase, partial [Gammaproteobacteria bacterium]|nr:M12 family metallo-peptidase [Gammaproteobacteria bacterium]
PGDGAAMMFRLADVYFAPGEIGNELDVVAIDGLEAVARMEQEVLSLSGPGATLNLDVGAVADFEFSQAFGPLAETALLTRWNNIDGIFSEQLGVQINVATTQIFTTSNDPFTTSAASALLDELANYRGATTAQDAQGITHLFTGRDLDGSTAGIAYFGAVCAHRGSFDGRSFGAGLSEARRGAVTDSLVAAHEIGHLFGAPHDGESTGACSATPTTFLMAPNINGSDQFSACSIRQIQAEIATARCLTPIGPANVKVLLTQPAQNALAGASFSQTATVRNDGADLATNTTFAATTEQGLEIVAVDAGGAACTVAANAANCSLGTLSGGTSRTVTLTLRAQSPGTLDLTATVAADADDVATDNSDTVTVTAIPAVDLVVSGTAPGIALNAQATINAVLDNAADFAATAVVVSAVASAGLRADQATLAGTACTIAAQAITCPARALAARANVTLVVTATGIVAGSQQLTVAATADEAERAPANNQLAIAVSVSAPQQGGGGGALSWWVVAALLASQCLAANGRRRQRVPTPS